MVDGRPDSKNRIASLEKQVAELNSAIADLVGLIKELLSKKPTKEQGEPSSKADEEEENSDKDEETAQKDSRKLAEEEGSYFRSLKVDFKIEIPMYDGSVNVDTLDDWLERLGTYFVFHQFTSEENITCVTLNLRQKNNCEEVVSWKQFKKLLRKEFYPIRFLEERWLKWYNLCQKNNQSVQEYTTEFQNQALVLDISVMEYSTFMKYVAKLHENLHKELTLFRS